MGKTFTWRSYSFLAVSVLVTLFMFSSDLIGTTISEELATIVLYGVLIGALISVVLGVSAFAAKREKRLISFIALFITTINLSVIAFFLWFGANFS